MSKLWDLFVSQLVARGWALLVFAGLMLLWTPVAFALDAWAASWLDTASAVALLAIGLACVGVYLWHWVVGYERRQDSRRRRVRV